MRKTIFFIILFSISVFIVKMMLHSEWREKYPELAKERDAKRTKEEIQQDNQREERRRQEKLRHYHSSAEYKKEVLEERQKREEERIRQLLEEQEERDGKVNKVVFSITRKRVKTDKDKERSVEAQRLATKLEAMTPKERQEKREADKIYMRAYRAGRQLSEKDCQAAAERTARYRSNMDDEKKEKARETAKIGMQKSRGNEKRRMEEDPVAYAEETFMPRTRRQHLMTSKKNRRAEKFNKKTRKYDELVSYWNEEKQEYLYVSSTAEHFRDNLWSVLPTCTCSTGRKICQKGPRVFEGKMRSHIYKQDYRECKIHRVYNYLEKVADLKDTSFLDAIQ